MTEPYATPRPRGGRSGGSKYLPTPNRRKTKKAAVAPVPDTCPKCERALHPGKYHDCGEQPSLFAELN